MKWNFTVNVTGKSKNKEFSSEVEKKAREVALSNGSAPRQSIFKVDLVFYLGDKRWLKKNPEIPREDHGRDLDNLIKPIFDALGPIIGPRHKWSNKREGRPTKIGESGAKDSRIVEVRAKKLNSGSDEESVSIEIENIII